VVAPSTSTPALATPPVSSVEVAPFIAQHVGDPGRPHASLPPVTDLAHLPGKLGLVAGLRNLRRTMHRGVDHMREQIDRYGKVYRHSLGPFPIVWIADPELLFEISRNDSRAWSTALGWRLLFDGIDPTRPYVDSPGGVDFEAHKDIRRLLQPGFNAASLAGYVQSTVEVVTPVIEGWLAAGRVSFKTAARRLFATIANRVFLGVSDPDETARLDRAMADFWKGPLAISKRAWLSPTWRRACRGYASLRDSLRAQVAERRASERTDLFSRVCRTAREIEWVDDDALVSCYLGVMAAAFDTTSLAVTSMAYALATHPEWQDRLHDEARVLPDPIGSEDVKKLELCDRVWRETLRRYPVAGSLPRRPLRDVEVAGHRIPAGAMVLVHIAALHHDPEVWTSPSTFDPDRFAPERAEDRRRRGAYMPFGAGAHSCIGAQLSTMEAKAFWATFVRRARIRLARPYTARHEITPLGCVSGDVELIVEPRS
jgi:cytochrome P450